ncbi:MAG: hypothetical protein IKC15_01880 [Kiritimatiellae bacterium]|nr:hypothetical protein [Kiritimatiellia bacterium]
MNMVKKLVCGVVCAAVALGAASVYAADADVTGLVPTLRLTFDGQSLANTGSGSLTMSGGVTTYVESEQGYALDTPTCAPYGSISGVFAANRDSAIAAVAKLGTKSTGILFHFRNGNTSIMLRRGAAANQIVLTENNSSSALITVNDIANGDTEYHLYVVNILQGRVDLYVDGVLAGTTTTTPRASDLVNWQFGGRHGGVISGEAICGGPIDDLRVYASALSTEQMSALGDSLLPALMIRSIPTQHVFPGIRPEPGFTITNRQTGASWTFEEGGVAPAGCPFEASYSLADGVGTATATGKAGGGYEGVTVIRNYVVTDQMLRNGGFEEVAGSPLAAVGWTGGQTLDANSGYKPNLSGTFINGTYCAAITKSANKTQVFSNGQMCIATLSWRYKRRPNFSSSPIYYTVLLDGEVIRPEEKVTDQEVHADSILGLMIMPGQHTLVFQSRTDGNADMTLFLDDVSLQVVMTPKLFILPIEDQMCTGVELSPSVVVSNLASGAIYTVGGGASSEFFDLTCVNSTTSGVAMATVTGKVGTAYEGQSTIRYFRTHTNFHVTDCSLVTEGNGCSWSSPMSITNALAKAVDGDKILLKSGTITATFTIAVNKTIPILGGYAGTDDTTLDPVSPMTVFDGNNVSTVPSIFDVSTATGADTTNILERIEFRNGYGHGFYKTGNASLVLRDCAFTSNGVSANLNTYGRGGYFVGDSAATLSFERCIFARNAYTGKQLTLGTGYGAYIKTWKRVFIDDSLFVSNGLTSAMVNGGYQGAGRDGNYGAAFTADSAPLTVRNTAFRANLAGTTASDGRGTVVYVTGNCSGSQFLNCIFAGNACEQCHNNGFQDTAKAGVLVLAADSVSRTLTVDGCTFAYNVFDGTFGAAGICAVKGALTLRNSIFFGAKGGVRRRCGKDLHVYDTATANVDYCLFEEDSDDCFTTALPNILVMGEHNVFGDPLFATPLSAITPYLITSGAYTGYTLSAFDEILSSIDVHVSNTAAAFSRAIDTGDPSSPYANEPAPNGGVVNLGAYGNTAEAATSTFQGTPTLAAGDISISFADDTRPTVSATIGGSTPYNALFKIEISGEDLSQVGAVVESVAAGGVQTGESLTLAGLGYYTPGEPLYVRVTVTAPGQSAIVVNTSATVTGTLPPYVGHGGGANVIHVREGADGLQDGSNWANAFASFTEAQRALAGNADKTEMWIAGTIVETVAPASVTIAAPLTIRGGFTGVEDSADERVPGAVSTLDGNGTRDLLKLANAAANPIKVERLIFARAYKRALENTGVGALTVTDCQFVNSRAVGPSGTNDDYGRGAYLNGKFVAAFTNCVFRGNVKVNLGSSHAQGSAIYAEGLTRVFVDNCLFVTNGVISTSGLGESTAGRDQADGDCIYMYNSPITATRCHFRGNRGAIRYNGGRTSGGVILLRGTCGGSAFTNCTFTGNWGGWATHKSSMTTTYVAGGTVDIRLDSATDKVDFENCTIAYNLGDTYCIPGGLHVESGDVNMHNCIIFGNRHGRMTLDGIGHDIYVRGTSKLNLSHCRLAAADAETPGKPDTNYVSAASTATLTYDNLTFGDPLFLTPLADFESELKVVDSGSYEGFSFLGTSYNVSGNVISTSNANANFDVHLRSKYGMYNNAGEFVKASGYLSDAIDAGDRNSPYQNEPQPNGRRVNLGAYGNTPWASMSMSYGSVYYLR